MQMPHPLDRKHQQEAYDRIINSKAKYVIAKLKTGLGKSALAAQAACAGRKVMACVMTKSLQWQYVDPYGFTELFGKGNYECEGYGQEIDSLDGSEEKVSADLCEVPKGYKDLCRDTCPYPLARDAFIHSQAGVTNYSKFLSDRSIVNSTERSFGFDPEILVLDEAHELSDLVVAFSGLSYQWKHKYLRDYASPIREDVEEIMERKGVPLPVAQSWVISSALEWLDGLWESLNQYKPEHPLKGGNASLWRWHRRQLDKVEITMENIKTAPECWFVHADKDSITIRPKTAQFHFKKLFDKAPKIVMMSATVQRKDILSLGISPDEFEFVSMPNPFPPESRPVHDLDAPKITAKTPLSECRQHAQMIADIFNGKSDHWNGIVHMPSKKKSEDWAEWLFQMTRRPVWTPKRDLGTDEAQRQWMKFESENTGAIAVTWNMMTGIDGKNININICGCVPYPNFGDRFQRARFDYNPGEARVRVANVIEQQMGRNRRGFDEHYGKDAEKFNGIADGKWARLKSAFDKDFLTSIHKKEHY